jgi:hypothetical protein
MHCRPSHCWCSILLVMVVQKLGTNIRGSEHLSDVERHWSAELGIPKSEIGNDNLPFL